MDYFQQFKKSQDINEGLFDKILNKGGNSEPKVSENSDFFQKPDGTFVIGGNSTAKEVNTPSAIPFLKEFDWKNSKLNFLLLPGTEFHAKYINFDIKNQIISNFKGHWKSGPFYGENFEGLFEGSSFQGEFVDRYTNYESHPTTFIDGKFIDTTNSGILGIPNILTLHKARSKKFNFIAIPAGHYLQFKSVNGIIGYIKVLKRLDAINSDFQFEVLDGFKGQQKGVLVNLPWNYFRQNWHTGIFNIHPKSPRNIAGLIVVPEGDSIQELYISSAPATFEVPEKQNLASVDSLKFDPNKNYSFDLSKLPINIPDLTGDNKVNLSFTTRQEFEEFNRVLNSIGSGILNFDIKNIQRAIQHNEVDGYGVFNYLSSVFNNVPGKNIMAILGKARKTVSEAKTGTLPTSKFKEPEENKKGVFYKKKKPGPVSYTTPNTQSVNSEKNVDFKQDVPSSMQRLNDFVKYFVENIVDSQDFNVKNAILLGLKSALGTNVIKPNLSQKAGETAAKNVTSGLGLHENLRIEVRRIINDSF